MGGSAVPVIDVLKFDPSDQNAILYACGNTIICDTLAEARRLSFGSKERHKVVTLDGTLIHKSGLMTGGLSGIELHAQKWDQKRIDGINFFFDCFFLTTLFFRIKTNQRKIYFRIS